MYTWLSGHRSVFMCPVKEPEFFSTDLDTGSIESIGEYEQLFEGADENHRIIGEASVTYLYSRRAINNIEITYDTPKYIVMLRNPIEMAHSYHEQRVYSGQETVTDFKTAWKLSPKRRDGRQVSRWCREPLLSDYMRVCRLGQQLERMCDCVSPNRIQCILLDDIKRSSVREYRRVLDFLGIEYDGRRNFDPHNTAKGLRSTAVRKLINSIRRVWRPVKSSLPVKGTWSTGLLNKVTRWNTEQRARNRMSDEMRAELAAYFADDVERLESLLGRDLSKWLDE